MAYRLRIATTVLLASLALAGCAPAVEQEPEDGGASVAMQAFLDALSEGDYAAAIALSTSSSADFACGWLGESGSQSIAAPTISELTEASDTATAQVEYGVPEKVSQEFSLVRTDENWLVELPESYRINLNFDAPVVGEVRVADRPGGTCVSARRCQSAWV